MASWAGFAPHQPSVIERLVQKGGPVEELLDQEELLQEWKLQSPKLLSLFVPHPTLFLVHVRI
jgi:hypothetical protein